jgi:hypothetical protein
MTVRKADEAHYSGEVPIRSRERLQLSRFFLARIVEITRVQTAERWARQGAEEVGGEGVPIGRAGANWR